MTRGEITFAIISGLLINEATDICPWIAIRLTRWAARLRYPHAPERAATRVEELAALINDRPGKLFKLFTALGFAVHALVVVGRNRQLAGLPGWGAAAKRTVDVGIAAVALVVTLPLWLLVALAIRLTSPGPVFFHQERVTKDGRIFRMHKFRTMRAGSAPSDATGPFFKPEDDPRLTRVGAFLRRLSLDELPQFWNVLVGDMSIVGPRPLPVEQVAANLELLRPRYVVPAGITGWWQINGRSRVTLEEALHLDLFYLANWSLALDLYILLKTFGAAFSGWGWHKTAEPRAFEHRPGTGWAARADLPPGVVTLICRACEPGPVIGTHCNLCGRTDVDVYQFRLLLEGLTIWASLCEGCYPPDRP